MSRWSPGAVSTSGAKIFFGLQSYFGVYLVVVDSCYLLYGNTLPLSHRSVSFSHIPKYWYLRDYEVIDQKPLSCMSYKISSGFTVEKSRI